MGELNDGDLFTVLLISGSLIRMSFVFVSFLPSLFLNKKYRSIYMNEWTNASANGIDIIIDSRCSLDFGSYSVDNTVSFVSWLLIDSNLFIIQRKAIQSGNKINDPFSNGFFFLIGRSSIWMTAKQC